MDPAIQYTTTSDGASIAYWTLGEGAPYIFCFNGLGSNIEYEWRIPEGRAAFERLARQVKVVRFDLRNSGLSQRGLDRVSLDDWVRDLEAVVAKLGPGPVGLHGGVYTTKVVVQYAARHPERVSRISMFRPTVGPQSRQERIPGLDRLYPIADDNWPLFTELLATAYVGLANADFARSMAGLLAESHSPEEYRATMSALISGDVRPLLDQVKAPALVLHRKNHLFDMEVSRSVAAALSNCRLAILEGIIPWPWDAPMLEALERFIAETAAAESAEPAGTPAAASAFRTLLFTDLEGHTEMMQRLGDARGREVLREHERLTRDALSEHGGSEIKTMGDGFMASFGSAQRALECATSLQRAFAARKGEPLKVRMGINAGEPVAEENDLFGASVITASRVSGLAHGGEILVSNVVRELVTGKGFLFSDRGEHSLKGLDEPLRIWELRWRGEGA
jgi:class 3 adenylate cyclase/pimeloyl-ACP methyl ester carboxylesterase